MVGLHGSRSRGSGYTVLFILRLRTAALPRRLPRCPFTPGLRGSVWLRGYRTRCRYHTHHLRCALRSRLLVCRSLAVPAHAVHRTLCRLQFLPRDFATPWLRLRYWFGYTDTLRWFARLRAHTARSPRLHLPHTRALGLVRTVPYGYRLLPLHVAVAVYVLYLTVGWFTGSHRGYGSAHRTVWLRTRTHPALYWLVAYPRSAVLPAVVTFTRL